jgi:predicted permease
MIGQMFSLMGEMLLLMLVGWLIRRVGILTKEGKKCLTDLILYVILPCNITKAFISEKLDSELWGSMIVVLIVAILIQILCTVISAFAYRRMEEGQKEVFQYATVCSNAGFMGNPLSQAVFGDLGLLYTSIYLIPQRIVMWTAGVSYFTRASDKKNLMKKVLVHPCMIAVYIGMFLMLTGIALPDFLMKTITSISSCTGAMTMIYIGTIFTEVNWKELVTPSQVYFAVLRLAVIPLIVYIPCRLLGLDPVVTGVSTFLAAMPAGSTTSLLASKYGADEVSAAKCVIFTTALSVVSLPVWGMILT